MRYSLILLAAGGLSLAGIVRADNAVRPPAAANSSVRLDADDEYVQQLREYRRTLNGVHDELAKEHPDRAGHRKEAIEAIDHAVKAIDDEIVEAKNHR